MARRPYDREVEYLEGDGTQFVRLGYNDNDGLDFELGIMPVNPSSWTNYFGGSSGDNLNCVRVRTGSGAGRYSIACGGPYNASCGHVTGGFDIVKVGPSGISVNDEVDALSSYNVGTSFSGAEVGLFAFLVNGSPHNSGSCRVRYLTARSAGIIVLDLIPVRVGAVGYMYDRVSGRLYGNAGSGAFALGPDVASAEPKAFYLGRKKEIPPTARDYVQNGLVAMWDGIENAGYGVHDNSLAYWYDLAREDGGGTAVRVASADGSSWNELGLLIPAGKNLAVGGDGTTYMSEPFGSADTITDYTFEIGLDVQDFSSSISPFSLVRVNATSVEIFRPWAEKQMRMAKATRIRVSYDADKTVEQINLDEFVGTSPRFFISDVNSATHGAIWLNGEERAQSIVNLNMSGKWRFCPILFNPSGDAFRLLYTRVYNRALTDAEIAANYAVDKRRFGL